MHDQALATMSDALRIVVAGSGFVDKVELRRVAFLCRQFYYDGDLRATLGLLSSSTYQFFGLCRDGRHEEAMALEAAHPEIEEAAHAAFTRAHLSRRLMHLLLSRAPDAFIRRIVARVRGPQGATPLPPVEASNARNAMLADVRDDAWDRRRHLVVDFKATRAERERRGRMMPW
jgi:hypothetical protein